MPPGLDSSRGLPGPFHICKMGQCHQKQTSPSRTTEYGHRKLFPNSNSGEPFEESASTQLHDSMGRPPTSGASPSASVKGGHPGPLENRTTETLTLLVPQATHVPRQVAPPYPPSICSAFNYAHSFPTTLGDKSHA